MKTRWRTAAGLMLLAGSLHAQLAFFAAEQKLGAAYRMAGVAAGGVAEVRLQVRNTGSAAAVLDSLTISGVAFSLPQPPRLPLPLAPGAGLDFTVRFEPAESGSYSASLRAGDASLLLTAYASQAPLLYLEYGGTLRLLAGAAEVDFGAVERGTPAARKFVLQNPPGQPAALVNLAVEGDGFSLSGHPGQALLAAGETARFEVLCDPAVSGPQEAVLRVDQRSYRLRAMALDPPLPRPELVVNLPDARSGQQGTVAVRLAAPSGTRASGRVRLFFQPAVNPTASDPAIMFASGAKMAPFSIEIGDSEAHFGEKSFAGFQTGSTAGTLTLVLELDPYSDERMVTLLPSPVNISTASAARGTSSVDVEVAGFDNTRSASRLAFTFYDRSGTAIPPGAVRVDATEDFRRYFAGADLGGLFALKARFPVTGDAAAIGAVEVEITNSAGTARSARIALP